MQHVSSSQPFCHVQRSHTHDEDEEGEVEDANDEDCSGEESGEGEGGVAELIGALPRAEGGE